MSTLIISWDDAKIVEIEKRGELFYSSVNYENVLRAKEKGFPVSLLKQISIVSDELAPVIKRRIPNPKTLRKRIAFKNEEDDREVENAICEYINDTRCRRPTDKFSIRIEIGSN